MAGAPFQVAEDWFTRGIPANVRLGADVCIDSSYAFDGMLSTADPAMVLKDASGVYGLAIFMVGPGGRVEVGEYTVLNACSLVCESRITIGAHCLLAWGSVVTDSWPGTAGIAARAAALRQAAGDPMRWIPAAVAPKPVSIADNCWIGSDAIVMPGVNIGRGAVVGSRCVITADVPPYAVVVGNPGRIVRFLEPDDDEATRAAAYRGFMRSTGAAAAPKE